MIGLVSCYYSLLLKCSVMRHIDLNSNKIGPELVPGHRPCELKNRGKNEMVSSQGDLNSDVSPCNVLGPFTPKLYNTNGTRNDISTDFTLVITGL